MSYLVLARKWRPQNFGDMVGQGHITRVLANAIRSNRIAHCYLFTGVRGVGKTTAARILAKALNCESGPTPEPCNQCSHCAEIMGGRSMDVYEIDGASNRGIDEVRQIIENARYQPAQCRFKIYIIDEVHQVTRDAFNALLKTLEEPPPFVRFILATTEPHRLPDTIRSRCQRFDFRRIQVLEMSRRLADIAKAESLRISEGALLLIAREAQGSMRDAQSLLEQVLSYAAPTGEGNESSTEVDEPLLQDILGIAPRNVLFAIGQAALLGKPEQCIERVAEAAANGLDLPRLSQELVEHFRNLLVARLLTDQAGRTPPQSAGAGQLFDLHDQEIKELKEQVKDLSLDTLMDYFRVMVKGDDEIARSSHPRFALESTLVRLATLPRSMDVAEALQRLEQIEGRLSGSAPAQTPRSSEKLSPPGLVHERPKPAQVAPTDSGTVAPSTSRNTSPDPPAEGGNVKQWSAFVAYVMKEKKFLASHLQQVRPLSLPPGKLRIGVEDRHQLSYLQDRDNLSALESFARRFFSTDVSVAISPLSAESAAEGVPAKPLPPHGDDSGQDMIGEALKIFGGSIKEVKGKS